MDFKDLSPTGRAFRNPLTTNFLCAFPTHDSMLAGEYKDCDVRAQADGTFDFIINFITEVIVENGRAYFGGGY